MARPPANFNPTLKSYLHSHGATIQHYLLKGKWPPSSAIDVIDDGTHRITVSVAPSGESNPGSLPILDVQQLVVRKIPEAPKSAGTVNARMLAIVESMPECIGWSARKWAKDLGCSSAAVTKTRAWKRILAARAVHRADRARGNEVDDNR